MPGPRLYCPGRVCRVFSFKVTEPIPLQHSSSVRQKGGLPGPPTRSPRPRIHQSVEDTKLSTNKQHSLSLASQAAYAEALLPGYQDRPGLRPVCVGCLFLRSPGQVPCVC